LIVRDLILFHTIAMVIMTLLINGTTSKIVLDKIGLIENKSIRLNFKKRFIALINE